VLGISALDPIARGVPFGSMLFSRSVPFVSFVISPTAPSRFLDALPVVASTEDELILRFGEPEIRLYLDADLELLQRTGLPLEGIDLDALPPGRGLPAPFDTDDTAWVLESVHSFEDLIAAMALMRVEHAGWVSASSSPVAPRRRGSSSPSCAEAASCCSTTSR
jgi:hypothetical protein